MTLAAGTCRAGPPSVVGNLISSYKILSQMMSLTTIPITPEVRDRLKRLATKGETYDALLRRMIAEVEMRMLYEREKRILDTEEFVPLDRA